MPRKIKSIFSKIEDWFDFIFKSSASNQIRISKTNPSKFGSYSQLKRYQKHFRKVVLEFFLAVAFLFIGIIFGPIILEEQFRSEIYMPDGKGDIVIGNISKNQATVIFKTLDQTSENKPLATSARVEIYLDSNFTVLYKKTDIFEYAVTHIIPLNGLQEGRTYYLKLIASENANMTNSKEVTMWGGKTPISFFTSGEVISNCNSIQIQNKPISENKINEIGVEEQVQFAPPSEIDSQNSLMLGNSKLSISAVESENYLHGNKKVQTIVFWETNIPANSSLLYRSESEGSEIEISGGGGFSKRHQITLVTLKPETNYYFKVKSRAENGEIAISEEYSMRTPEPEDDISGMVNENLKALLRQIGF